ncbi:MAG: conjugal transfer protein TrbD [Campylobacterales bacterium]|nr:conjugal transfer protein TrbD [Campylobacterales bacterium]
MAHQEELKKIKIHSALNKPNLLFGAERELILLLGLFSAMMIFIAMTWQTFIAGIIMWVILSTLLRMMGKADPMMSKVYIRQMKYNSFYPAKSTPYKREA